MAMLSKSLFVFAIIGLLSVASAATLSSQTLEDRLYRVEFALGQSAVTLRDEISGSERAIYRFGARAGQTMDVKLASTTRLVEFAVYDAKAWPNGRPLAASTVVGALVPELNRYIGKLPATGDYRIVLRHVRDLSLPGQRSSFRLDVSITGGSPQDGGTVTQLPGDTAVGSTTAFWKVTGLTVGDKLNMRAGPGTSFRVVDRLVMGEVVRNEGCVASGGTEWCEVSRPDRLREIGWVSARFLSPSKAPQSGGATQLPGDGLVSGTPYSATGNLACRIADRARTCAFGVIRRSRGDASLNVTLPSGTMRRIEFLGGRPVSSNAPGGVFGEWTASGAVIVRIGTSEQYTVEEAVLFGG